MGTVLPKASPPTEINPTPGPNRQLVASAFGVTIGEVEVGTGTDVGVSEGTMGGDVGVSEGIIGVSEGINGGDVGVSVGIKAMTGAMNMLKEVGRSGFEATGIG
jgi:hypothetical protein